VIDLNIAKIESCIEAILFACGSEMSLTRISQSLEIDEKTAARIIKGLSDKYHNEKRGIQIIEINNSYQMCTNSEYYEYITKALNLSSKKTLTQSLLETLAIIAYRQPVTKSEIEDIRGVSAEHAVNKLMEYGLIEELGRKDSPGKPILFGTSNEFLKHFGYKDIRELPIIENNEEEN
jgi:segregation and condensation protein B